MSREIKVRAWFVESQVMYSWEDLINRIGISASTFVETEVWKPMQYTGRQACTDELDADGIHQQKQDLYGGDIIRHEITDMDLPADYEPLFETHEVRYSDADVAWRCGPYSLQSVLAGSHRLIGDIHTNPKLLEEKSHA